MLAYFTSKKIPPSLRIVRVTNDKSVYVLPKLVVGWFVTLVKFGLMIISRLFNVNEILIDKKRYQVIILGNQSQWVGLICPRTLVEIR